MRTNVDRMPRISRSEIEICNMSAEHSRRRDIELFARLSLGDELDPGVDLTALFRRVEAMAPSDADLAWSVIKNYWRMCNARLRHYRTFCEGNGTLLLLLPMVRRAYFSLALLAFRALTGLRVVSLRRMQPILQFLYS